MSLSGTPSQSAYPDEFSDSMANLTASIVQEQLAPILETLRDHAKLLDLHAALLNHSTAMNRYNVGKLEDIRDFQTNINYKLQFYVEPEDRVYPTYRNPQARVRPQRTATLLNIESDSRLPGNASDPTDEPSSAEPSATNTTTNARTPSASQQDQDPPSSPATTERAPSPPPSPQFTGEGFSVVPGPSRRLQRERPFGVQPDPMWNSNRTINPFLRLAAPPPPPPYVAPPAYTTEDANANANPRADHDHDAAESRAATATATATATLTAQRATTPPSVPRPDFEAIGEGSAVPSSTSTNVNIDATDNAHPRTPPSLTSRSSVAAPTTTTAAGAGAGAAIASEGEGGPDSDSDPDVDPSSQLSEKARGKKRMREEDDSGCLSPHDEDDDEDDPFVAGGGGGGSNSSRRDGPSHKRRKTDADTDTDTDADARPNTDRLDLSPCSWGTNSTSFMDSLFSLAERRRNSEKLKSIGRMYRAAQ